MMKKVRFIDPPTGWAYGFPKAIPEDISDHGEELFDWMISEGYPEKDRNLLNHCRFWIEEVKENEDSK